MQGRKCRVRFRRRWGFGHKCSFEGDGYRVPGEKYQGRIQELLAPGGPGGTWSHRYGNYINMRKTCDGGSYPPGGGFPKGPPEAPLAGACWGSHPQHKRVRDPRNQNNRALGRLPAAENML